MRKQQTTTKQPAVNGVRITSGKCVNVGIKFGKERAGIQRKPAAFVQLPYWTEISDRRRHKRKHVLLSVRKGKQQHTHDEQRRRRSEWCVGKRANGFEEAAGDLLVLPSFRLAYNVIIKLRTGVPRNGLLGRVFGTFGKLSVALPYWLRTIREG